MFCDQILQLHKSLLATRSAILIGSPGSGKTTVYNTLSTAINSLHNKEVEKRTEKKTDKLSEQESKTSSKASKKPSAQPRSKEAEGFLWPRVETTVIFPKTLTSQEVNIRSDFNLLYILILTNY